jgi:hypothetical protein
MFVPFDEKGKIFTNVVAKKPAVVVLQTTTNFIRGKIHIRPDERIKDAVNQPEIFLAVTEAIIYDNQMKELYRCNFLAVNRDQIVWIIPEVEIESLEGS